MVYPKYLTRIVGATHLRRTLTETRWGAKWRVGRDVPIRLTEAVTKSKKCRILYHCPV
jgi:hypothetical protein